MLDIRYPIEADEHGVIDGIRLSTALIRTAVNLLIPYIGTCSGCLDTAFSKIANEVLEDAHQELKTGEANPTIFTPGLNGGSVTLQSKLTWLIVKKPFMNCCYLDRMKTTPTFIEGQCFVVTA